MVRGAAFVTIISCTLQNNQGDR